MTGENSNKPNPGTAKWQKITGSYDLWGSADVRVKGDVVTMTFTAHAEDRYNFNKGGAKDIATGLPDAANGRFQELGWARSFTSHGTTARTVQWTLGSAATTTWASRVAMQPNPYSRR
jgi:hypothetical protein